MGVPFAMCLPAARTQPEQRGVVRFEFESHLEGNLSSQAVEPAHRDVEEPQTDGALQVCVLGTDSVPAYGGGQVVDRRAAGHVGVRDDAERDEGLQRTVDGGAMHTRLKGVDLRSDGLRIKVAAARIEYLENSPPCRGHPLTSAAKLLQRAEHRARFTDHDEPRSISVPIAARNLEEMLAWWTPRA